MRVNQAANIASDLIDKLVNQLLGDRVTSSVFCPKQLLKKRLFLDSMTIAVNYAGLFYEASANALILHYRYSNPCCKVKIFLVKTKNSRRRQCTAQPDTYYP